MANEDNLQVIRSEKEAREKGKKGGIASGEARRRKNRRCPQGRAAFFAQRQTVCRRGGCGA